MINYADWDKQITIPKMSGTEFINKYGEYLIRSFTAIKVEFTFPNNVVFPNLPVRLDKGSLMYPLSGQSLTSSQSILRKTISHPRYENLISKLLNGERLPQETGVLELL